jgi:hypothetical protein
MIQVFVLEEKDVIKPKDLVRSMFKLSEHSQADIMSGDDKAHIWDFAQNAMTYWVGKTLGDYQKIGGRYPVQIIRTEGEPHESFRIKGRPYRPNEKRPR